MTDDAQISCERFGCLKLTDLETIILLSQVCVGVYYELDLDFNLPAQLLEPLEQLLGGRLSTIRLGGRCRPIVSRNTSIDASIIGVGVRFRKSESCLLELNEEVSSCCFRLFSALENSESEKLTSLR